MTRTHDRPKGGPGHGGQAGATGPLVAVGPAAADWATAAVQQGGGRVAAGGDESVQADALVWLDPHDIEGLREALGRLPGARWVQLPFAGVEAVADTGLISAERVWTSAKGAYAEPVAEHALALALAGLRLLPERARATSWGPQAGLSLFDASVTILGGGGITRCLLHLLEPFRAQVTVVRRSPEPVPGAVRTLATEALPDALPGALVVFLALALTPQTTGIIGEPELAFMGADSWLVNVARGRHVVTEDLVAALRDNRIGGAALDVTDPEPLPDGHPLWSLPNALVTPHTADTWPMVERLLGERITDNVARFGSGEPLVGVVEPEAGY